MSKRNKAFRRHKEHSKYIRRTKYRMIGESFIWDDNGNKIYNPTIADGLKVRQFKVYKSTGTPCSCWMCISQKKYSRKAFQKNTSFAIKNAE